jgi:hypothetical protein
MEGRLNLFNDLSWLLGPANGRSQYCAIGPEVRVGATGSCMIFRVASFRMPLHLTPTNEKTAVH